LPKFAHAALLEFAERLLLSAGASQRDASLVAGLLLKADLQGYAGHGISHVPSYVSRIRSGLLRLDTRPRVVREGKTTAVVDAHHFIGQVAAHEGMKLAIAKAREHGVGIVCLFRSGHVGRLADYVELAVEQGMIGIALASVGGGSVAAYGGMEPFAGTNPIAFGVPARGGEHIVLDFATAAMSMGELRRKVSKGEAIPPGVMLDGQGHPTTEFKAFLGPPRGVILPFGGYKGSGLHLMAEILGGILSGNGLGREWWDRGGPAINGVFLEAISVEEFQPTDVFMDKVDELAALFKSTRAAPGFDEIFLPGERSRRRAEKHLREGIEIDGAAWAQLAQCASELGIQDLPRPLS